MLSIASRHVVRPASKVIRETKTRSAARPLVKGNRASTKAIATTFALSASNATSSSTKLFSLQKEVKRYYTIPPMKASDPEESFKTEFAKDGMRVYTRKEIGRHNTRTDGWIVIEDKVYNVTSWIEFHPGGQNPILEHLGGEATIDFRAVGHSHRAYDVLASLHIGYVKEKRRYTCN